MVENSSEIGLSKPASDTTAEAEGTWMFGSISCCATTGVSAMALAPTTAAVPAIS